ncbi:hypothetical protein ANCDUO_25463, partial [Ancylostoma duodenale]
MLHPDTVSGGISCTGAGKPIWSRIQSDNKRQAGTSRSLFSTRLGSSPWSQNNSQLLETKINSSLTKDLWPANNPDLNPLDFSVWGFIEKKLRSRNVKNLVDLRRKLIKIWNNLDVNYLRSTTDSMKKRINVCIKADGG